MLRVLSTKKLSLNQKELLLNSGIALVEYNAIQIEFKELNLPVTNYGHAIFTSKNAVKAILNKGLKIDHCYCVGDKTAALLKDQGFSIAEKCINSLELAQRITSNHSDKSFAFFCGNLRRDELPAYLKEQQIAIEEIQVYSTKLNPKKINGIFDATMFFSPSAVRSFMEINSTDAPAFCIGETTAKETRKFGLKTIIATTPGVENVIAKVVGYLKNIKNNQPGG